MCKYLIQIVGENAYYTTTQLQDEEDLDVLIDIKHKHNCWTKWCSSFEESKPFEGCWRLGCACCCWAVLVRIRGSLSFVIHSRLNPKHRHSQSFKRKSVFQAKWKTTDCFVETTDCFILRCFEKRLKTVFQMVKLLKPKQPIDSRKQLIVCFGTITEKLF